MKKYILFFTACLFMTAYSAQAQISMVSGSHQTCKTSYHDQNGDGVKEKVVVCGTEAHVFLGKSNHSYDRTRISTKFTQKGVYDGYKKSLRDVNGDGIGDVVFTGEQTRYIYLGKSNGTFNKLRKQG